MTRLFADPDWQCRNWIRDIVAHHAAENAHLQRAAAAKGYGMTLADQSKYARPFPGTVQINAPNLNSGAAGTSPTAAADEGNASAPSRAPLSVGPWLLLGMMLLAGLLGTAGGGLVAYVLSRGETARIHVFWGDEEITPDKPATAAAE